VIESTQFDMAINELVGVLLSGEPVGSPLRLLRVCSIDDIREVTLLVEFNAGYDVLTFGMHHGFDDSPHRPIPVLRMISKLVVPRFVLPELLYWKEICDQKPGNCSAAAS